MINNKMYKFRKLFSYLSTVCFVTASGSACAFYDAYPKTEASCTPVPASENLFLSDAKLESYQEAQLLECVNHKLLPKHLDIASGYLSTKVSGNWTFGGADGKVFRIIASTMDSLQQEIKYTQQTNQYRAKIHRWKDNAIISLGAGLQAFTRYQNADNLYVASVRYDGYVTIKVKYKGNYKTLAKTKLNNNTKNYLDDNGHLATGQWYKISFSAFEEKLTLSLDGVELLSVNNNLLSEGTIGIRSDSVEAYLDDWLLLDSDVAKVEAPAISQVFMRGKATPRNSDNFTYNGECYQAQNSPGIWCASQKDTWFWNNVECAAMQGINADLASIHTPINMPDDRSNTHIDNLNAGVV